jgi:hypothetical protein
MAEGGAKGRSAQLERVLKIIRDVSRLDGTDMYEFAQKYGAAVRTIRRELEALGWLGIPLAREADPRTARRFDIGSTRRTTSRWRRRPSRREPLPRAQGGDERRRRRRARDRAVRDARGPRREDRAGRRAEGARKARVRGAVLPVVGQARVSANAARAPLAPCEGDQGAAHLSCRVPRGVESRGGAPGTRSCRSGCSYTTAPSTFSASLPGAAVSAR